MNRALLNRANTTKAEIYTVDAFLSAKECATLRGYIDDKARPSTVWQGNDLVEVVSPDRTSSTAWLKASDYPLVAMIDRRIAQLLDYPIENAEVTQGQKYEPGQEFVDHTDFIDRKWYRRFTKGQRVWTCMIYLNGDCTGGSTEFSRLELSFSPVEGMALVWKNTRRFNLPNRDTLHAGRPVLAGTKYIITKWFRDMKL